jgi:hypothetical protein
MATTRTFGTALVFGDVPAIRPIINVPGWATQVRVRLRNGEVVRVYVRGGGRIECWVVTDTPDGGELVLQRARNVTLNPPSATTGRPAPRKSLLGRFADFCRGVLSPRHETNRP